MIAFTVLSPVSRPSVQSGEMSDGQHQRLSRCTVSFGSFKYFCVPDMGLGAVSEECVAVLLKNTRAHGRKAVVPLEYDSCI